MSEQTAPERDYFTDHSVLKEPYEFFEQLSAHGPVYQARSRDVLFVTGFPEAVAILNNNRDYSSVIAPAGAAVPLPFQPAGDDISEQIERHRNEFPG